MSDVEVKIEPSVARMLDRYTWPPEAAPDWTDVLVRASVVAPQRPKRRIALAATVLAALVTLTLATPLGGAIRRGVGDFSSWLRGTPGEPVSADEQRAFEEAEKRSWTHFGETPQLRQLATVEHDGIDYRLLGFRRGNALCIRLLASGAASGSTTECAPVADLAADEAPVRVLLADWGVGKGTKTRTIGFDTVTARRAQVTAGIAADGVAAVELIDGTGTNRAPAENNAFLYVAEQPDVGQRVTHVRAQLTGGEVVSVPFTPAPFGMSGGFQVGAGEPGGPAKVERRLDGGRIGWLDRREARGESIDVLPPRVVRHPGRGENEFARVLTPDAQSAKRLLVAITKQRLQAPSPLPPVRAAGGGNAVCYFLVVGGSSGGGCSPLAKLFPDAPFTFGYSVMGAGAQYGTFSGLASDDVARLELFTSTGNKIDVPLRDNAFIVDVALARMPAKLVAYDAEGLVIGIRETPRDEGTGTVVGEPLVERTLAVDGGAVDLKAYRTDEGGHCWFVRARGPVHLNMGGCSPARWTKAPVRVTPLGDPVVGFAGRARPDVATVVFRFKEGEERLTPDAHGYVLQAARTAGAGQRDLVEIVALDADGKTIHREKLRQR